MQLYYFLAVILSLSFGSLPQSNHDFGHAVAFSGMVILAWWVICIASVQLVGGLIDKNEINETVGYQWFDRQMECFRWFSLGLVVLCLGGFGLGRNLDQLPVVQHSIAAQSLILLTPAIAMMVGLWAAEAVFASRYAGGEKGVRATGKWILDSMRFSVGWLLIPILGFMAVIDLVSLVSIDQLIPVWVGWAALVIAVVVGLPMLVRRVFPTRPMEQETKLWIESIAAAAGIGGCRVIMWDTGYRTNNAMVAGFLGRFRVLLVSDRLVRELSREELSMVILHEAAHAKRFHIPLRIAALIPAWILGASVQWGITRFADSSSVMQALEPWAGSLGSAFSILATVLILRLVSYHSEFDADAYACRIAPAVSATINDTMPSGVPKTQGDACRHLAAALWQVTADCPASRKPTWLHPGIAQRVDALCVTEHTTERATDCVTEMPRLGLQTE